MRRSAAGRLSAVGLVGLVAVVTFCIRAHVLPTSPFVASAAKVGAGKLWLLPASALLVDRPVLIGLVAFAVLAVATLRVCGTATFWAAAILGHVGSTLSIYATIGATRLADPDAFAAAVRSPDFGVSAMQGAWVGAIAVTAWLAAGAHRRRRLLVIAAVLGVAALAWWLHPDPSILTTEHGVAFLIGCAVVWPRRAATARTAFMAHARAVLSTDV